MTRKRVLLRVDLNVPLDPEGETLCDYRIRRMAGLVRRLRRSGCTALVCSHLGRPQSRDQQLSLSRFLAPLQRLLDCSARFLPDCVGRQVEEVITESTPGSVFLLENLRFHPGEVSNDPSFTAALARLASVFINDAFAVSHRAHASIVGVPSLLPAFAGPTFTDEYQRLLALVRDIRPPVVVISGGIKLDKLSVYRRLLPQVDALLLGSGFAAALRDDSTSLSDPLLSGRIVCPPDLVVDRSHDLMVRSAAQLSRGDRIVDIGPETARHYMEFIQNAGTVVFNGSLGLLASDHPLSQTRHLLWGIAQSRAVKVACGGTGCSLFIQEGLAHRVDYIFPGGGATLSFLDGQVNAAIPLLVDSTSPELARVAISHEEDPRNGGDKGWVRPGNGGPSGSQ